MESRKLRIAFVDYVVEPDKPGRTGLSDVVWDMASELVNQGHEAHVIASYHTDTYPDPRVTVHNFPTPPIGYRNVIGHFWILKRAAEIAKRLRPDIIHAPEYISTAVFAALGVRSPLVLTVPGNVYHRIEKGHSYEWYYLQILKAAARISARRCAAVLAISQEMKRWWEWTGSAPEKTPWIPYGINSSRFHPIRNARKQLNIPEDRLFLLYVGRFASEKGIYDLLDALSNIKHLLRPEHVQIVLAGKGPDADDIKKRVMMSELDSVIQIRSWINQNELSSWYSAADALIMPSHSEPLGRVMLEAMACGTPVIASASEGPMDHIVEQQNGFLFTPHDIGTLTSILELVVRNQEILRHMRASTLHYTQDHLNWQHIVNRVVREVYFPLTDVKTTLLTLHEG